MVDASKGHATVPPPRKRILTPNVKLDRLYQRIATDPELEHLRYQRKLIVGHGPIKPRVMVIVEMPEPQDERIGVALTGPAGVVLKSMLHVAELKRSSHTFVTPFLKYRTPAERDATKAETDVLLPYLVDEIRIVTPQVLVTCGRFVNNLLFPDASLSKLRGTVQEWRGWTVLPTLDLMAAMHDTVNRPVMVQTFRMLGNMV